MTQTVFEGDPESRTQSAGRKRSLTNNSSESRKRRRNLKDQTSVPAKDHFTVLSQQEDDFDLPNEEAAYRLDTANMSGLKYGRNRLAEGFAKHKTNLETQQQSRSPGEITNTSVSSSRPPGDSPVNVIEISDDEMDGGIVINLHSRSSSEELGEIVSPPQNNAKLQDNKPDLFVVDPAPSIPRKRLVDLSSRELEFQMNYAFFHLDRYQIDLNRPALCLVCLGEGHLETDCERNRRDTGPFPAYKIDLEKQVKLWISCCVCASKSHLVGDCPHVQDDKAVRWSLKALNSQQIVNLSLQTGTTALEREAENRNMRPAGLQIKGRAGIYHAGVAASDAQDSSEDELFLRRPVGAGAGTGRGDGREGHRRHDRHNGSINSRPYRGGGTWYATDTFGRRRSRSPDDRGDTYRPQHGRVPSPTRNGRAPTSASRGPPTSSGPNIQFSLPSRKGSNRWTEANKASSGNSALNSQGSGYTQAKSRKKSKKT